MTDLEEAAGPLLLRWIRHPILTTLSGGGGGGGGKGASDGPGNESQRDPLASLSLPASPNINNNNNSTSSSNDVDNFEDVLVEFLSFLINIFKFNSAYLDEEVVSGGVGRAGDVSVTGSLNRWAGFSFEGIGHVGFI